MRLRIPPSLAASVTAEEIANTLIQGTGTVLSVIGVVVLVHLAVQQGGALAVASVAVYGGSMVLAFLASTLYHGTWHVRAKRIFQTADHCTIYALIAGTYTPVALLVLQGAWGWALTAIVWATALTGAVLKIALRGRFPKTRIVLYIVLGWLVVFWAKPIFEGLGPGGSALLIAGGLLYTVGVLFYRWRRLPFNRPIWHVFVVAASACHFGAIAFYAIPAAA